MGLVRLTARLSTALAALLVGSFMNCHDPITFDVKTITVGTTERAVEAQYLVVGDQADMPPIAQSSDDLLVMRAGINGVPCRLVFLMDAPPTSRQN
jgi:hypothetical protein